MVETGARDHRFIPASGVCNFRDMGGLPTEDGRRIRPGKLYRSDHWRYATRADRELTRRAPAIRNIIDLRTSGERSEHGVFPVAAGQTLHELTMVHLTWDRFDGTDADPAVHGDLPGFLAQRYAAVMETGWESVRDSLNVVAGGDPTLVHCMSGTDRTGIVIAVALSLAGVSDEEIAADYVLSNVGVDRIRARRAGVDPADYEGASDHCRVETIPAAFAMVRERFGSIETYARVIGLTDVAALRRSLVES
ncbi:tyrosine-protein phosphatase [Salininema proteolyticum]|uniref:Tyrosine-protein phosphatase n=1 Tax=Salininema proteolyticum TaxID=1607685 RepID=A0ABV8TU17_9ACTN